MKFTSAHHFREEIYQYAGSVHSPISQAMAGISFPCSDYEILRQDPQCYSIEYVYEGEGVINEGDKQQKVSAGDFFILHPHMRHHYFSNPTNPWKKIWLLVLGNTDYITSLLKLYNLDSVWYIPQCGTPFVLEEIFDLMKHDDCDMHHSLEKNILDLITKLCDYIYSDTTDVSPLVLAKQFIHKRITTRLSVAEVSAHLHMNPSYFCRIFKKEFGISPVAYILQTKVNDSKFLLQNTSLSVSELAFHYEFTDSAHYIRTFSRYTGMTPMQYRAQCRLGSKPAQ